MAFSNQLKELLRKSGWKAADLARAANLSEAAISDYLKGKKEPRGKQSIAIAKALHVSLDTLWETEFDPLPAGDHAQQPSELKQAAIVRIEKMDENQVKAVLAFMDSLEAVEENILFHKGKRS